MYRGFQQKSKEGNVEESSMRTGLHVHKIGCRDKKGTKQEYKHKHKIQQMQICHRLDKGYKESRANIQIQKTRKANRQDIQIRNARNANIGKIYKYKMQEKQIGKKGGTAETR